MDIEQDKEPESEKATKPTQQETNDSEMNNEQETEPEAKKARKDAKEVRCEEEPTDQEAKEPETKKARITEIGQIEQKGRAAVINLFSPAGTSNIERATR